MALRCALPEGPEALCAACLRAAAQLGGGLAERLFLALADLPEHPSTVAAEEPGVRACPACGLGPTEMLDAAMAGCPECYRWFAHVLLPQPGAVGGQAPA
ncbi:MAG: hypothetical protein NT029_15590 [Armatimonadetes bacterium]|nr:hypothetical protein [Armatimonadota bacterium]